MLVIVSKSVISPSTVSMSQIRSKGLKGPVDSIKNQGELNVQVYLMLV